MRQVAVFLFLILVLSIRPVLSFSSYDEALPLLLAQSDYGITRNWTANIILANYDSSVINETALLETMPTQRIHNAAPTLITYNIEYNIYYTDQAYYKSLRQVALDNSEVGPDIGTLLNETALQLQVNDPQTPRQVFNDRGSRSIDGFVIEDWLMDNPFVSPPGLGYNFYILNFSEFDSTNHSMEHWFDYHPQDPDTNLPQDWFRLEFDHHLNPPLTMQYPGIGGRGNIYVLDPSADQWYLRWARIWWQEEITTEYDFWTKDLEDITRDLNLTSSVGRVKFNQYLRNYMFDIVSFVLFPSLHQPARYVTYGEIKLAVICVNEPGGIHSGSLRWITDARLLKSYLNELYPFVEWDVELHFIDTDENPFWNNTFWSYANLSGDGTTEVAGGALFNHIFEIIRPYQITTTSENINVFGTVFIKSDMLMYANGGTYTGLGMSGPDGGQTLVCKSLERYYQADNVTPREGVSGIQLHETLHAIGFSHTWKHNHYAGDFSYGPMGYFTMHNGTSSFDKNWVQGTYLDQMESELWADFLFKQGYLDPSNPDKTFIAEHNALDTFQMARERYNKMNWYGAYLALCKARDWTHRMIYSRTDDTTPVIHSWGTIQSITNNSAFEYWVYVTDRSGIENVTLYAQVDENTTFQFVCTYDNPNWTVSISGIAFQSNLTLWVVVWDWGMNRAEGGVIKTLVQKEPDWIDLLLPLSMIIGSVGFVTAVALLQRKRLKSELT